MSMCCYRQSQSDCVCAVWQCTHLHQVIVERSEYSSSVSSPPQPVVCVSQSILHRSNGVILQGSTRTNNAPLTTTAIPPLVLLGCASIVAT